jgi:hypothetical protein
MPFLQALISHRATICAYAVHFQTSRSLKFIFYISVVYFFAFISLLPYVNPWWTKASRFSHTNTTQHSMILALVPLSLQNFVVIVERKLQIWYRDDIETTFLESFAVLEKMPWISSPNTSVLFSKKVSKFNLFWDHLIVSHIEYFPGNIFKRTIYNIKNFTCALVNITIRVRCSFDRCSYLQHNALPDLEKTHLLLKSATTFFSEMRWQK